VPSYALTCGQHKFGENTNTRGIFLIHSNKTKNQSEIRHDGESA
jgi:hypothetical protein